MRGVHVRYGFSPRSHEELVFAIDLAHRLSGRLFVWTETDLDARALIKSLGSPNLAEREHAHVSDRVRMLIGRMEAGLTPRFCNGDPLRAVRDPDSIVIGTDDAKGRPVAAAIATMGEPAIGARGGGEVCLPFANGESALHAASAAIPIAAKLGMSLLLYHATWRDDGLPTDAPPARHMTAEASAVFDGIVELANGAGVKHRVIVETATAIAEGTVRTALNEHCALIALARGRHVGRGSYVDQVLERSVIPVLVAGRSSL